MINQVTIIIVTKVKTVNSCVFLSLGKSDHQLVYLVHSCEDRSLSMYQRAKLPRIIKTWAIFIFQPGHSLCVPPLALVIELEVLGV